MPRVYPGYSLHDELALLVEAGMTLQQALHAATLAPARFLGIEAISGTVAVGKHADFVLLDADPLEDIRNARRIRSVIVDGRFPASSSHSMDYDSKNSKRPRCPHYCPSNEINSEQE